LANSISHQNISQIISTIIITELAYRSIVSTPSN